MLKVVSIGGFGHSVCVFNEMLNSNQAELKGIAPAFEGEDLSAICSHPLCKNVKIYKNSKILFTQTQPDIAIVSTRLDLIPGAIIESIANGCDVISEKPLALNRKDLLAIHNTARQYGKIVAAMLTMRNEAVFCTARKLYQDGVIGEAVLCNARKSYKYGIRPDWFGDREKYGGTIGWVGIHAFDIINFVTSLEFRSVAAISSNFCHPERPACDDNCSLVLEMSNGGTATISLDYFRPEKAVSHGDDWVRIVGTKGIIEASAAKGECTLITNSCGAFNAELMPQDKIFVKFFESMMNHDAANRNWQRTSFVLTSVCLHAQEAAENHKLMKIEDLYMESVE